MRVLLFGLGLFLLSTQSAQAQREVFKQVKICVDYSVQFEDAENTPRVFTDGAGDFWRDNSDTRAAIGMKFEISSTVDTTSGHLGTNGCVTVGLQVPVGDQTVDVEVESRTRRRGVDIIMRYTDTTVDVPYTNDDTDHLWEDGATVTQTWTDLPVPLSGASVNVHDGLLIPAVGGWQHLAVGTWMIHRNKFGLDSGLVRPCCLNGGGDDGVCPGGNGYERTVAPYLAASPELRILATQQGNCCGSRIVTELQAHPSHFFSGFSGWRNFQRRFAIAHEIGHVLAGLRMGGREDGQYVGTAPLDECVGDVDPDDFTPISSDCDGKRNLFTKEYMAVVAREGWADFVSAYVWNSKNQNDCSIKSVTRYIDFDLDGDADNYFGANDWRNGIHSCLDEPWFQPAPSGNPTASYVGDTNWLDEVQTGGACYRFDQSPTALCASPGNCEDEWLMESLNRSTIYDWQRMMFTLYQQDGLTLKDLSDLYINMCPRNWRRDDGACDDSLYLGIGDDLPASRLFQSSGALGTTIDTAVNARSNMVLH